MTVPVTADQIRAERTRTIDQVKRLYAVVMGYAVTSCLSNIYGCGKMTGFRVDAALLALLAQGFTFVSLAALFYLGAERMLDSRYLGVDSPVPTRRGLLFDLMSLGVTAGWLVILADTFPIPPATPFANDDAGQAALAAFVQTVLDSQGRFTRNLIALYVLDAVFVLGQLIRLMPGPSDAVRIRTATAHQIWMVLNLGCIVLLTIFLKDWQAGTMDLGFIRMNALTFWLVTIHLVRFLFDFFATFEFYYPTQPLP
jgi:hypothetical protein